MTAMHTSLKVFAHAMVICLASIFTLRGEAAEDPGKFRPLFNGQDLTGWQVERGDPSMWKAENGVIVGTSVDFRSRSFLLTDREYSDFVLRLEFNVDQLNTGSAVGLRASPGEEMPYDDRGRFYDHPKLWLRTMLGESGECNWLRGETTLKPDRSASMNPPGSWNTMEVEVKGRTLRASVNGQQILETTSDAGVSLRGGSLPGLNRVKGRIGLQSYNGTVCYRNIQIMSLVNSDPPTPILAREPESLVGVRVRPKAPDVKVKVSEQTVAIGAIFSSGARVEKVNGNWLWITIPEGIQGKAVSGWIARDDVFTPEEAIVHFKGQIAANPKKADFYNSLSDTYSGLGKKTEAEDALTQGLREVGDDRSLYRSRASLRLDKGNLDGALADLEAQVNLGEDVENPASVRLAYILRGSILLYRKNQPDKAMQEMETAIVLWPKEPMCYQLRAGAWAAKGQLAKALADYAFAIQLEPAEPQNYLLRAAIWSRKEEFGNALADYTAVIRLAPQNAAAYNSRAWIWATCSVEEHRDGAKAIADAEQACTLTKWKAWGYLDTLAAAYASAGQFDKAIEMEQKAVALAPGPRKNDLNARLALFRAGKPYRVASKPKTTPPKVQVSPGPGN